MDMQPSRSRKNRSSGSGESRKPGQKRPSEVCRKHWISIATFDKWRAKYGGLDASDAKRPKALEDQNTKLKKLLAEAMFDNAMLTDFASK
ncbi:putative transposase [Bradyrhizobium sp. USDA 4503]